MFGKTRKMLVLRDKHDGSVYDDVSQRRSSTEVKSVTRGLGQSNPATIVNGGKTGQAVVVRLIL